MKWNEKQLKAINARDKNLLISASAGSGKTAVLVERIVQLCIQKQVDIDKFLVVTFTKAAAGEMKERIAKRLIELRTEPKNARFVSRQLSILQNANISTLHSFCSNVIKSNFYEIDLDPNFRIASEQNIEILKNQALEEVLSYYYARANALLDEGSTSEYEAGFEIDASESNIRAFIHFANSYFSYKNDNMLKATIDRLYHFAMSQPYPMEWLKCAMSMDLPKIYIGIFKAFSISLFGFIADLKFCIKLCCEDTGLEKYREALIDDYTKFEVIYQNVREFLSKFEAEISTDELVDFKGEFVSACDALIDKIAGFGSHKAFGRVKKELADEEVQNFVKSSRDNIKKRFAYYNQKFFDRHYAQNDEDIKKLEPIISVFAKLTMDYANRFYELKTDEKLLDFNDLEHKTIEILKNPDIAAAYKNTIKYIFVDEYQDTNRVQEEITNLIKGDGNLFFVGDVKQSIYGFRMADPELFLNKMNEYSPFGAEANMRIDLNGNYRSSPSILNGINHVFDLLMSDKFGGLDYKPDGRLEAGRTDFEIEYAPVFHTISPAEDVQHSSETASPEEKSAENAEDEDQDMDLCTLEAHFIAQRIGKLLNEPIYDAKRAELRKPQLDDFVILLRSVKGDAQVIQKVLLSYGLSASSSDQSNYFDVPEVLNLINFMRIIDNPYEDIALLGTMRSMFGGFNDTDLALIRLECKEEKFFYDAVQIYIQRHTDDLADRLLHFIHVLENYRNTNFQKLIDLVYTIFETYNYKYFVASLPNGNVRLGYLESFEKEVLKFENENNSQLYHFMEYVERLRNMGVNYGSVSNVESGNKSIKIMSIHKSKGLEFPIVFLARLGKKFNEMDLRNSILFHRDFNISAMYMDSKHYVKHSNVTYEFVKHKLLNELFEEEQRLLYVALTRAVNRLECVASFKSREDITKLVENSINGKLRQIARTGADQMGLDDLHLDKFDIYDLNAHFAMYSKLMYNRRYLDWLSATIDFESGIWELNNQEVQMSESSTADALKSSIHSIELMNEYGALEYPTYSIHCDLSPKKQSISAFSKKIALLHSGAKSIDSDIVPEMKREFELDEYMEDQIIAQKSLSFGEYAVNTERAKNTNENMLAMQRGRAYHRLAELLARDFIVDKCDSLEGLNKESINVKLQKYIEGNLIDAEAAKMIDMDKMFRLFKSEQLKLASLATYSSVEKEFVYKYELDGTYTLLQGVVDMMYTSDLGLVIIDYKTDKIKDMQVLVDRYRGQLSLYARSLREILDLEIADMLLYSFELEKWISAK